MIRKIHVSCTAAVLKLLVVWPGLDPTTGYMMSHSLNSTDVTKLADRKG